MGYVPKTKLKVKWRVAIPFFILIFLIIYLIANVFFIPKKENNEGFTICNYSRNKTLSLLNKDFANTYEINDYFFYGETLNLLKDPYDAQKNDELNGKTIKLVNLCTDEEMLFPLENTIDHQLTLNDLSNGFYEIYLVYNLENHRLTSPKVISEIFHTITRSDTTKKVELISNKDFLGNENTLQNNYFSINVTSDIKQHDSFDIMLDPAGGNDDYQMGVDWGFEANGLLENDEMYKAALALKTELEKYGLSVGITKDSMKEEINTYGVNGRLWKGYNKNAKLYVNLQFNSSTYDQVRGMEVYHSAYSSPSLANKILYDLKKNANIDGSTLYASGTSVDGVVASSLVVGMDERKVYDDIMQIRESGGKATQAGMVSENAEKMNASFAKDNVRGMQAIVIKFLYISNEEDARLWKENFDQIISETAKSIADSLKINLQSQQ